MFYHQSHWWLVSSSFTRVPRSPQIHIPILSLKSWQAHFKVSLKSLYHLCLVLLALKFGYSTLPLSLLHWSTQISLTSDLCSFSYNSSSSLNFFPFLPLSFLCFGANCELGIPLSNITFPHPNILFIIFKWDYCVCSSDLLHFIYLPVAVNYMLSFFLIAA